VAGGSRIKESNNKEDRVQAILAERGHHRGLVHIFSATETLRRQNPVGLRNSVG
jgi:hypothetical protein